VSPPSPAARTLRIAVIACAGLVFFLPLWWVIVSSLRPEDDIFRYLNPLSAWTFLPNRWTFEHVTALWTSPFARAILNSVLVAGATVALGLVVCALAAFALAVIDFPGRAAVFAVMVVSFLIPFDAIAVPLFDIFRSAGLQNSYAGLILPGVGNGLAIFLLRQFFLGIPRELSEAALVDGMGWFQVFWRIYLPLSVPALISAALIMFIFQWQAYLWPLLIAPSNDYKVAAVALAQFASAYDVNFGVIFAGAMFVSLIPMVVLVGFQRYFTTSVAATGGKE
jgi:ABC-type glycerol-3-phosphate transport system permease component